MPTMGVYAIRNKVNGKQYIGASINIERRWLVHRSGSSNTALSRDMRTNRDVFDLVVLETVNQASELPEAESRWREQFDQQLLYNNPHLDHHGNWQHRTGRSANSHGHNGR